MSKSNPFKPGYGLPPPYLAGREEEQKLLNRRLDDMAAGELVNGVAIYGPRGMGKTVLLGWLQKQCAKRGIRHVEGTSATMLGSVDGLAKSLLPFTWHPGEWLTSWSPGDWRIGLGTTAVSADVSASAQGAGKESLLIKRLISRCRRRPLVVLLDEAHEPPSLDVLRILLHTAQLVAQEAPFLLVLAGTPGLTDTLRNARSTFIERAESVGLGCLNEKAAASALRIPLKKEGIKIADDALNAAVEDSQHYPFFIQEWGEVLWNHAKEEKAEGLAQENINLVKTDIQAKRDGFYESRYESIGKSPKLLAAAYAVAQALLTGQQELSRNSIADIVRSSLSENASDAADIENTAEEIIDELGRLDFFWRPPTSRFVVPGIPSFMAYVTNRAIE